MTRKQLKEKAALEAYPEKIMYSTLIEQNVDYNGRDRVIYKQGYDKGFEDALDKACEWIEKFAYNSVVTDNIGEREKQAIIITFKKAMEEQR